MYEAVRVRKRAGSFFMFMKVLNWAMSVVMARVEETTREEKSVYTVSGNDRAVGRE